MADANEDDDAKGKDSSLDGSEAAPMSTVSISTGLESALLSSRSSLTRLIRIIVDPFSFASWASTFAV